MEKHISPLKIAAVIVLVLKIIIFSVACVMSMKILVGGSGEGSASSSIASSEEELVGTDLSGLLYIMAFLFFAFPLVVVPAGFLIYLLIYTFTGSKISVVMKVLILIFGSVISGILLLCDSEEDT